MTEVSAQTAAGPGNGNVGPVAGMTVRDAAFEVMRRHGLTTIFGNPGSTEIAFLTDLPSDIRFVLGLHEGSVVGMATGYALARGEPAFVNLHTAAGLGNAINAIANARDCRAPLVIVVGQQDRRQIAFEPFLTGRALERLAGEYPVWRQLPARGQDVPGAIARAYHEAKAAKGPALLVVPMGDWLEPADELAAGAPARVLRPHSVDSSQVEELAEMLAGAESPAIVVGAVGEGSEGWDAVIALAERLRCPVWQEPFTRARQLPSGSPAVRRSSVLAAPPHARRARELRRRADRRDQRVQGLPVRRAGRARRAGYARRGAHRRPGRGSPQPVRRGRRGAAWPRRAVRSSSGCPSAPATRPSRSAGRRRCRRRPRESRSAPVTCSTRWRSGSRTTCCWSRRCPSAQPELYQRIPIRVPFGFLSTANGCLGFGLSGSIGLRMGLPDRPVVAVLGDGSTMYAIQALWSAARYDVGVLLIVLANGRYAVMDGLARRHGGVGAWPGFEAVDIGGLARSLGCPSVRVESHEDLLRVLDEVLPDLVARREPLLLEAVVREQA